MTQSIKLIIALVAILMALGVSNAFAIERCPGYSSCSSGFTQIPSRVGVVTKAYCGQNGSSCCDCSTVKANMQEQMDIHRRQFFLGTYWTGTVYPGLQKLLNRISGTMVKQSVAQGGFGDAQNNLNSLTDLQKGAAASAVNYLPSESLCRFGSLTESLGADEIKSRSQQLALSTIALKRSLGSRQNAAESGQASDVSSRMDEFVKEYCDKNDQGVDLMCGSDSVRRFPDQPKDTRYNRDIDYTRTIDADQTLNVDFIGSTGDLKPAEQDVVSLAYNLYGSQQMAARVSDKQMNQRRGQNIYLKVRSVSAARSVAENTYMAITAMKTRGTGGSQAYMNALIKELGVNADATSGVLSDKPSYYAQMDVLSKKLYQDPTFYVNLMEGKTNVARQSAAMGGIEVMQDRDIYQSMRRSEMLLALLIELQAGKTLKDVGEDVNTK